MSKTLVVVLGHGSRREEGRAAIVEIARNYQVKHQEYIVKHAFMEFTMPDLNAAVEEACEEAMIQVVIVMPLFLALGNHVLRDLPQEMTALQEKYPDKVFYMTDPIGSDPILSDIIDARVNTVI